MPNSSLRPLRIVLALSFAAASAFAYAPSKTKEAAPVKTDTVWISRPAGDSCAEQPLEAGAEDLKKAGVHVVTQRKMGDGQMHMQMCGAPTGISNTYEIPKAELDRALKLGFVSAPEKK